MISNSTRRHGDTRHRHRTARILSCLAILTVLCSVNALSVQAMTVSRAVTASPIATTSIVDDGMPAVNASLPYATQATSTTALPLQASTNGKTVVASSAVASRTAGSLNPDLVSQAVSEAAATTTPTSASGDARNRVASTRSSIRRPDKSEAKAAATSTAWTYAAGSFGCEQGVASGVAHMCHATGVPLARRSGDEAPFDTFWSKRQSDSSTTPADVLDSNSPKRGWLDVLVGAVPYKKGDLIASIAWILATAALFPLFAIRLFRRSSSIAHVLVCVSVWGCCMVATFGIRAYLSDRTPTTTLMSVENTLLQLLPCLLIEPLLHLLSLYATAGGVPTGVPHVALLLRILNLVALVLFVTGAACMAGWMNGWDVALQGNGQIDNHAMFPDFQPPGISRVGPIVGAGLQVVASVGALLLVPVARGKSGSIRPGGFIAFLVLLIAVPVVYRVAQTLNAQAVLNSEAAGGSQNLIQAVATTTTMSAAVKNAVLKLMPMYAVAPPGMYSSGVAGIDWEQLQQTLAGRGGIQSPLMFNMLYVLPQWLMLMLFFFVHAPAKQQSDDKLASAPTEP